MEFYHEWDKWERSLTVTVFMGKRVYESTLRLLPLCPCCRGTGGYGGSYDPPEPPEPCGYCNSEQVVTPWRWLTFEIGSRFWDSRLGEWLNTYHAWVDAPAAEFEDCLDLVYWRQFDKPAC